MTRTATILGLVRRLREPRYLALTLLMLVVAAICIGAGSWQIARLAQKAGWNSELRRNAHAAPVPLASLIPLTTQSGRPSSHRIQFHTVTATGSYDPSHVQLVRDATVNDTAGYYVLTPFDTAQGSLLVVRGFIASPATATAVPAAPAPPAGTVTIRARIQPGDAQHDGATELTDNQVASINPHDQAARLGRPVFDAYAEVLPTEPGVGDLIAIPSPDLSNPAGGAVEPQHVAYIIQWYLFALLALAAPIAMVRAESRRAPRGEFDDEDGTHDPTPDELRRAKLTDRYGRVR